LFSSRPSSRPGASSSRASGLGMPNIMEIMPAGLRIISLNISDILRIVALAEFHQQFPDKDALLLLSSSAKAPERIIERWRQIDFHLNGEIYRHIAPLGRERAVSPWRGRFLSWRGALSTSGGIHGPPLASLLPRSRGIAGLLAAAPQNPQ